MAYGSGVMHVDPSQLPGMVSKIQSTISTMEGDMTSLQNQIRSYLDSGLTMPSTSPAIEAQFTKYQANMKTMTENLHSFSQMFQSIVSNLEQLDHQFGSSISKG